MKILKGIATYTAVLIGILIIVGALIFAVLYFNSNASFFGYSVINYSSVLHDSQYSKELELEQNASVTVNINAYVHDVEIYLTSADYVSIKRYDQLFGVVKNISYTNDTAIEVNTEGKEGTISISLCDTGSLTSGGKSYIKVAIPEKYSYSFNIVTTTGDININGLSTDGTTNKLLITDLSLTTTTGDASISNISTTKAQYDGEEVLGEGVTTLTDSSKSTYAYWSLNSLKVTTKSGKINLAVQDSGVVATTIINHFGDNNSTILKDLITTNNYESESSFTDLLSEVNGFYIHVSGRGDILLDKIRVSEITFTGQDILISANSVLTYNNLSIITPKGTFDISEIGGIDAVNSLTTISTDSMDVKLQNVVGDVSISTTYGNISIDEVNGNTRLSTDTGNITVGTATKPIVAYSQYGNITINNFQNKLAITNSYGDITAHYDYEYYSEFPGAKDDLYKLDLQITNGSGYTKLTNIVSELNLNITKSGNASVTFYDLPKSSSNDVVPNHTMTANGGKITIGVYMQAFQLKASGNISGTAYSQDFVASDVFKTYFTYAGDDNLTTLEISTGGSVEFTSYMDRP